jgi:hypothetical protein
MQRLYSMRQQNAENNTCRVAPSPTACAACIVGRCHDLHPASCFITIVCRVLIYDGSNHLRVSATVWLCAGNTCVIYTM